jgi:hypothetical protein
MVVAVRLSLKWTPAVSLKEGPEKTVAYFDRVLSGTVEELKAASA